VLYFKGQPINIDIPMFVELLDRPDRPGRTGRHGVGRFQTATLETGAVVKVPFYLNEGDVIKSTPGPGRSSNASSSDDIF